MLGCAGGHRQEERDDLHRRQVPGTARARRHLAADRRRRHRGEPGCLWFDWSRSVEDPNEYVLIEASRDDAAGAAPGQSDHFRPAQQTLPPHLAATRRIINVTVPDDDWSALGELAVPERR
jgi:quinol monooxygenase YgiN